MKTLEEKSELYAESKVYDWEREDIEDLLKFEAETDFRNGYISAFEWIKVENELPEVSMQLIHSGYNKRTLYPVLVKTSKGEYDLAKRDRYKHNSWEWYGTSVDKSTIIEWRKINID